jgi:sphingomyelin phosphodiesterase
MNRNFNIRTFDPGENLLTKYRYKNEPASLYDYIFLLNKGGTPESGLVTLKKFQTTSKYTIPPLGDLFDFTEGTELRDLSDHYGLSATFRYRL